MIIGKKFKFEHRKKAKKEEVSEVCGYNRHIPPAGTAIHYTINQCQCADYCVAILSSKVTLESYIDTSSEPSVIG